MRGEGRFRVFRTQHTCQEVIICRGAGKYVTFVNFPTQQCASYEFTGSRGKGAKDPAQRRVPSSPAGSSLSPAMSSLSLSSGLQLHIELHRRPVWVIVIGDPEMNVTLRPRPGVLFLARANVSPTQFYFQQLLFLFYRVLQDILL